MPPLPDSDDPFVLLGVPPTAREKDVRKAQARLLKIYRPRKALAEFDRVQAATLRALWLIEVRDREQRSGMKAGAGRLLTSGSPEAAPDGPVASADDRETWSRAFASKVTTEPEAALAMISAPEVLADAARDVEWAQAVLCAIGALTWRLPAVEDVHARLRLPTSEAVADLSARVRIDLDASRAYRAWHQPILLPGFFEVIADSRIVDEAQHRANLALFGEQVRVDAGEALAHFDAIASRCPALVEPLAQRLLEAVPADRRDLRDARPDVGDAIAARLREVSRHTGIARAVLVGAGACALCAVGGISAGTGGGGAFGGLAIWGCYSLETRQYEKSVRGEMARALVDLGVTRACARQWLDGNRRRALRLARFSYHMKQDKALLLLGMAAAATAATRPTGA